jgi:hypothetical protein
MSTVQEQCVEMSGVDLSCPVLLFWSIFIPSLHLLILLFFRSYNSFPHFTRKGSRSSDIIAIEITSTVCVTWFSIIGSIGYLNLFGFTDGNDLYEAGKFYGYSRFVHLQLITPMLVYQLWNLIACLVHNEYRDIPSLGHHIVTAGLAYCGFNPFAQYYALFYFGIAELTTIPLNFVNTFKNVPQLAQSYPAFYQHCRTVFAISFLLIRTIWWPIVSYGLFLACVDLISSETAHSVPVICYFLFSNLFLTSLQFYWGYLIIINALKGKEKKKKPVDKETTENLGNLKSD